MRVEVKYLEEGKGWYVFIDGVCDSTIRFETKEEAERHMEFLKEVL